MIKNKRFFLLICFISLYSAYLPAQNEDARIDAIPENTLSAENGEEETEEPTEEDEEIVQPQLTPEQQRIEMEIKTSTLPELAALCRSLGLSEHGTRDELSRRISEHYDLPERTAPEEEPRIITINSAQTIEYFRIDVIDEDYARLTGDVSISIADGDHIHLISAQEITFNRTRNIMTAKGRVIYTKTANTDGTTETFRGENITVNIDTWAAIFIDGDSERSIDTDETAYRFSGSIISRTDDDVTIIKDAVVTNSDQEEPYWSINASRLWLLPGSDFAFVNAVLRVGEIPLLWLPFFYYPADELIFHPVLGYRSREGGFIHTTTYILGRPKANEDEQFSITSILGSSGDMETERQGLFLRSTGRKAVNPDESSLRLLLDYYVNLGTFGAIELSLPRTGIFSQTLDFFAGVGFSRTIFNNSTPYNPSDGSFDWNYSNFFNYSVPFRYRLQFKSAISFRYGNISWDFSYLSDPEFDSDFMENRSESMDWFNLMQQDPSQTATTYSQKDPIWNINGSFTPNIRFLNPFVTRFSVSSFSTSLIFRRLQDNSIHSSSPVRIFYAPNTFTIYSFSAAISGNPLTIGRRRQSSSSDSETQSVNPLDGIGEPVSPWENTEPAGERAAPNDIITPPLLDISFNLPGDGNINFSIDYNIRPAGFSELQFRSGYENWESSDQVNWSEVQSVLTSFSGDVDLNFVLNHSSGLFSNSFTLSGLGRWRNYSYINEEAEAYRSPQNPSGIPNPDLVDNARREQYKHIRYASSYTFNGTLRPFLNDSVFNQSFFRYNLKGTLISSKRYVDGSNNPELTPVWGTWAKDDPANDIYGLNSHNMTTSLSASVFGQQQNLSFGIDLPPLDPSISANAVINLWYSSTIINFNLRRESLTAPARAGEWIYNPISITETLRYGSHSLVVYLAISPEDNNEITTIRTTLSLWNPMLTAIFNAKKATQYYFDPDLGRWVDIPNSDILQPESFSISFNRTFPDFSFLNNKINFNFSINTLLDFDLIRYTNSRFSFTMGFNLRITDILELKLNVISDNSVIFRYFKGIPAMDHLTYMYKDGPQNNIFIDFIDSFNFFDDNIRRRSGFKLRGFTIDLTHFLGDWEAKFEVKMLPYRPSTTSSWDIATDFSFIVQWKPISEIKTNVSYDGQTNRWTRE